MRIGWAGYMRSGARYLRSDWTRDVLVCGAFLLLAWFVTSGLWPHPELRVLSENVGDHVQHEWFLSRGPVIVNGDIALVTNRMNAPDGINLLTNTSIMLPAVLLAPVTLWFGPWTSFAVLVMVSLAATAAGWYLLFTR